MCSPSTAGASSLGPRAQLSPFFRNLMEPFNDPSSSSWYVGPEVPLLGGCWFRGHHVSRCQDVPAGFYGTRNRLGVFELILSRPAYSRFVQIVRLEHRPSVVRNPTESLSRTHTNTEACL